MPRDVELSEYVRREWRNDRSWMVKERKGKSTRIGLVDLVTFLVENRFARAKRCC